MNKYLTNFRNVYFGCLLAVTAAFLFLVGGVGLALLSMSYPIIGMIVIFFIVIPAVTAFIFVSLGFI